MNYKSKYLKYKIKYLNFKNKLISGGVKFNKDELPNNTNNQPSPVKRTIEKKDFRPIKFSSELFPYMDGRHMMDPVVPRSVSVDDFSKDDSERTFVFEKNQQIQKKVNEQNQAYPESLKGESAPLEELFSGLRVLPPE